MYSLRKKHFTEPVIALLGLQVLEASARSTKKEKTISRKTMRLILIIKILYSRCELRHY